MKRYNLNGTLYKNDVITKRTTIQKKAFNQHSTIKRARNFIRKKILKQTHRSCPRD